MLVYFRLFVAISICLLKTAALMGEMAISDPVKAELFYEEKSIQPGRPFWLAIRLEIADHWHTYWKNPGETGMAMQVNWTLPEGFKANPIEWPAPLRFDLDSIIGYGYEKEVILLAEIIPDNTVQGSNAKIEANVRYVVCSDSNCELGDKDLGITLPLSRVLPEKNESATALFSLGRSALPERNWNLSASWKNEFIEIQAKAPQNLKKNFSKAYFCPESQTMINGRGEISVTKSESDSDAYLIALPQGDDQPAALKGVLVFLSDENSINRQAVDVEIPIHDRNPNDIALADVKNREASSPLPVLDISSTSENSLNLGWALIFAFIGGAILNLMPCVLPVMSCKILSFVKMAGLSRKETFKHGLTFSSGVLISFWVLGGALLGLQAYGKSLGWGFQLQEPFFVAILAALFLLFSLSLFGVFEMGSSVTAWAGNAQQKSALKPESMLSSFFSGVLATAVATPCTGPFLGSAVGFAVTLSAPLAMLIFTSLGIGMAFPYLLLSMNPAWLKFMPKPGNWMVAFKELMGFLMLATVLWLAWVFGAQTGFDSLFQLFAAFFFLGIAAWIFGKWGTPVQSLKCRITSSIFSLSALSLAGYILFTAAFPAETTLAKEHGASLELADNWEHFSIERVKELKSQGKPVFIDFTAKWCLICQTNHAVLTQDSVSAKMKELGVVRMKADWTKKDPAITKALRQFGRSSLPLYVLYGTDPGQPAKILPQVLTPDLVLSYLNELENNIIADDSH